MIFAINEINNNPWLLPNITLGFHIFDNLYNSRRTYEATLDLLFKQKNNIPNYKCGRKDVFSVTGGLTSEYSMQMASILSNFKIPQVCACLLFSYTLSIFPFFEEKKRYWKNVIGSHKCWILIVWEAQCVCEECEECEETVFSSSGTTWR